MYTTVHPLTNYDYHSETNTYSKYDIETNLCYVITQRRKVNHGETGLWHWVGTIWTQGKKANYQKILHRIKEPCRTPEYAAELLDDYIVFEEDIDEQL